MSTMEERMVTDLPKGGTEILNLVLFSFRSTCCSRRLEQSTNILGFSLHHDHLRVRTMVSAARGW